MIGCEGNRRQANRIEAMRSGSTAEVAKNLQEKKSAFGYYIIYHTPVRIRFVREYDK